MRRVMLRLFWFAGVIPGVVAGLHDEREASAQDRGFTTGTKESFVSVIDEQIGQGWADNEVEAEANLVMDVTTAIRNVRAESHVPAKARPEILIKADAAAKAVIEADGALICELARAAAIGFVDAAPDGTARTVTEGGVEIFLPLAGLVDTEAEGARLQKAIDKLDGELKQVRGKLGNPNFVDKAPAAIVDKERGRLAELEDRRGKLVEGLQALGA